MIKKKILNPNRLRRINAGFSFIPHRFLTDGFLASLSQKEILLYLFLVLVSDRHGLSFYSYDSMCSQLELSANEYIEAREGLMEKSLIAFDGTIFQVLDLPPKPLKRPIANLALGFDRAQEPAAITQIIRKSLKEV